MYFSGVHLIHYLNSGYEIYLGGGPPFLLGVLFTERNANHIIRRAANCQSVAEV